ncbi:MAG: hypothetical protein ACRC6K_07975 [Fusobacteriaceae bacterium]
MIIHKKIKKIDKQYEIKEGVRYTLNKIFKKYDNAAVKYTYEDFLKDYGLRYKEYKELKTLFNILIKGYSPTSYLTSNFYNFLVKGFNYNAKIVKEENLEKLLDVLHIECSINNYSLILEKHRRHIELYGEKDNLEKFKEDYRIEEPILYEKFKEKWHLAFDGILAEYLRKIN